MDVVVLSRIQFALTIAFHYIFPPLSIGLGALLVIMEGAYLRTKNPLYERMVKFWVRIFGLIFALGVASGVVMEFQFGTNWAYYSRYVGDVFGSALAAEGLLAFFLESSFLAVLLFGWGRVGPRMHFFSTCMVAFGAMLSAVWIVVANSWMQTPAGYHVVQREGFTRVEITDFWKMVFNPSSMDRLSHVIMGCWQAGAWLVIGVGAFYLLRKKHEEFAKASIKIGLVLALFSSVLQLTTGHSSAITVSEYQPAKLAAMEGHFAKEAPAALHVLGWVDEEAGRVRFPVAVPNVLSFLVSGDFNKPLKGLNAFEEDDRPPLNITFQAYHAMVGIGFLLIGLAVLGVLLWWRGILFKQTWLLMAFVFASLGPQIANQVGWITAEVGRQPWIVYGLLRTEEGVSRAVSAGQVLGSIIMFSAIYFLLFVLFIFLLLRKIGAGPEVAADAGGPGSGRVKGHAN